MKTTTEDDAANICITVMQEKIKFVEIMQNHFLYSQGSEGIFILLASPSPDKRVKQKWYMNFLTLAAEG